MPLGGIGSGAKAAIPALMESLKDADEVVRYFAAGALGGIGPEAKAAVPALMELLKDTDGFVQISAVGTWEESVPRRRPPFPP